MGHGRVGAMKMRKIAMVHYDEIALKGNNRKVFEQFLVTNIALKIKSAGLPFTVANQWGRLVISASEDTSWNTKNNFSLRAILSNTPGVSVFGIGFSVAKEEKNMIQAAIGVAKNKGNEFETFRITTTRLDKSYSLVSQEVDALLGESVWEFFKKKKEVKLKNPDLTIRVEVHESEVYVYGKERGLSGLPVGSSGRAVALLSGGFDSPVATHMCAVRGVEPILMHFHAYPQTSRAAIEKVEDLAKVLHEVCGPITLLLVPLLDAQKEIALTAPEKLRVILYRRLMMKVAQAWGEKNNVKAIITGEAIGQVASQTLENISAVENATTLPVLRPLAGMNKQEIIDRSKEIGTHDISVLPHDDTCTVFMPKHPETKAKLKGVLEAEKKYNSESLVAHILENLEKNII